MSNRKISHTSFGVLLYASVLGIVFASSAYATLPLDPQHAPAGLTLIAYDGFDYTAGTSLTNIDGVQGSNGGIGWTSPWQAGPWRFRVSETTLNYPGLTTLGGSIQKYSYVGNDYSAATRSLPRQSSGVVYIQFLSNVTLNNGGGAPEVRLRDGNTTTAAIGNNGGSTVDILDGSLDVHKASSSTAIIGLHMNIVQIDYLAQTTKLWVDPDLSTFNFLRPPAASATATSFAPAFDALNVIIKGGSYDEIAVMRMNPPLEPTDFTINSGNKMLHLRWKAPVDSAVDGYRVQYRVSQNGTWQDAKRGCSLEETLDLDENCNMSGLDNGVQYDFRVAALNSSGASTWVSASGTPTNPGVGNSGRAEHSENVPVSIRPNKSSSLDAAHGKSAEAKKKG